MIRKAILRLVYSSLCLLLALHNVLLILEAVGKLGVRDDRKVLDVICPAYAGVCLKWLCEGRTWR